MAGKRTNNEARDIKRKIEKIQKTCVELKELGVAIGVIYSSKKTNGLHFFGDKRITAVVEEHKDELLLNSAWFDDENEEEIENRDPGFILPPLPAELQILNGVTLKSVIAGLINDLGLTWKSEKPSWWPTEFPFRHPKTVPENVCGNWSDGMRRIIAACYNYYGHNIDGYIVQELEDPRDRNILPQDLSHPQPPPTLPPAQLMPDQTTPLHSSTPRHLTSSSTYRPQQQHSPISPLPLTPRRNRALSPSSRRSIISPLPPTPCHSRALSPPPHSKRTKLSKQFTPLAVRRTRRNK